MIPGDKHDALAQWVLQSFEEVAKKARKEGRLEFPKAEGRTMDGHTAVPNPLDSISLSFRSLGRVNFPSAVPVPTTGPY